MSKTALLAATAVLALVAGGASAADRPSPTVSGKVVTSSFHTAKGSTVLYNQNSGGNGDGVDSQNFSSTYASYDDQGADDFIVPKKATWTVTEVDVTGAYYNGSGPATSEDVYFYMDKKGKPGKAVKHGSFTNIKGTGSPSFALSLGKKGVKLKAGHYWVSVVANCPFSGCGQWAWEITPTFHNDDAMWQNPGGGFGTSCTSWGTLATCSGATYAGDFMFELQGTSKK